MEKFKYSTDKLWACVSPKNFVDYSTLSNTKEGSIDSFTKNINYPNYDWSQSEYRGWKCILLTVEFKDNSSIVDVCNNEIFTN